MIESKVKWSTAAAFAAGIFLAVLNAVQDNPGLLDPLPKWVQAVLLAAGPTLATLLAGYAAPHTARAGYTPTSQRR